MATFSRLSIYGITLAGYVGEDVIIRYDPRDIAEIYVYHKDMFICRAICQELSGEFVGLKDIIAARNRHKRELNNVLTEHSKTIERFIDVHKPEFLREKPVEEPNQQKSETTIKSYSNE